MATKRQIIPRTEDGKLSYRPEGLDDFSRKVARELLETFPDIDISDLKCIFNTSLNFEIAMEFLREGAKKL